MNIIDEQKEIILHCPKCEKEKILCKNLDYFLIKAVWENVVLYKFTNNCECGENQSRNLIISGYKKPNDYFNACLDFMLLNYRGYNFRKWAKQEKRNNLKAERIKIFKTIDTKEGLFAEYIAFNTRYYIKTGE